MSDILLALLRFKNPKIMPVTTSQKIVIGCFENKTLFSIVKDRIIQWQFLKIKIACSDCPKEPFSKVAYIVNGKLE